MRAKSYYSFGSSLHRVLERFHDTGDAGVTTVGDALTAYEEGWIDAGFSSAEEMAEAFGEGKEIIARHVEQTLVSDRTAKTVFVEKQLRYDMGEFALIGRLDRLDEHPDGTLEIVDYKSGRTSVEPEEVAGDIAMSCYQLLVRRKYPMQPVRATIHALRSGQSASSSLTDQAIDEFEGDLKLLGSEIMGRAWEDLVPIPKSLCARCDFLPLCRQNPEFNLESVAPSP
jgi:putative RecB family exonuclease